MSVHLPICNIFVGSCFSANLKSISNRALSNIDPTCSADRKDNETV